MKKYEDESGKEIPKGRHEIAMEKALQKARDDGLVTEVDEGAATLLIAGARSLDIGEYEGKPYVAANVMAPMLAVLMELHMTVEARASKEGGALDELIKSLSDPEV